MDNLSDKGPEISTTSNIINEINTYHKLNWVELDASRYHRFDGLEF